MLKLFVAITIFVIVTVAKRDLLAKQCLSKTVAQGISGVVGIAVALRFPLIVG